MIGHDLDFSRKTEFFLSLKVKFEVDWMLFCNEDKNDPV